MPLGGALWWLFEKIGGAVVSEKVKEHLPWLRKAKKDVAAARKETEAALINLGKAEGDIVSLIDENEYLIEVTTYLAGCRDTVEHHCRNHGIALPRDYPPPKPHRRTIAQRIKARRSP